MVRPRLYLGCCRRCTSSSLVSDHQTARLSVGLSSIWSVSFVDFLLNSLTVQCPKPADFTLGQRMPASVVLNYEDGVYAIDSTHSEKDDPDKNVLTWLVGRGFGLKEI